MGYQEISPVKKLKKSPAERRDNPMMPEDYARLLTLLDPEDTFTELLVFVWHSGCRPQEVRHIEARHVNLEKQRIVFPKEESKGKRKPRVIYLSGITFEIIRALVDKYPEGKLFRNTRGGPWNKFSICNRMDRLSKQTGKPLAMYDARHGFGTRKLVQGHDHLTVAELMGHTDGSMLAKVYSHLDKNIEHLQNALKE